jgi:hypothetical protein
MGARWYSPELARFLSVDPLPGKIDDPLSQNSYSYCAADPVNRVDLTGKRFIGIDFGMPHPKMGDIVVSARALLEAGKLDLKGFKNYIELNSKRRMESFYARHRQTQRTEYWWTSSTLGSSSASSGAMTSEDLADIVNFNNDLLQALGIPPVLTPDVTPEQMEPILESVEQDYGVENPTFSDLLVISEAENALHMMEQTLGSLEGEMQAMAEVGIGRIDAINQLRAENDPFAGMAPAEITDAIEQMQHWNIPEGYIEYALMLHTDDYELRDAYMNHYEQAKAGAFDTPWLDVYGAIGSGRLSLNLTIDFGIGELNFNISSKRISADVNWGPNCPGISATVLEGPNPNKKVVGMKILHGGFGFEYGRVLVTYEDGSQELLFYGGVTPGADLGYQFKTTHVGEVSWSDAWDWLTGED